MSNIFYATWGWDEQYTPKEWVELLIPHIEHLKDKIIRCPFDKADSQFVIVLKEHGFKVVYSHIDYGQNFFEYQPKEWDVIISNPPYTNKRKYWERCLELWKPFALLLPLNILSDSMINVTMKNRGGGMWLLIPQKRMRFYNAITWEVWQSPTFKATYFGVNIFKQQLILESL